MKRPFKRLRLSKNVSCVIEQARDSLSSSVGFFIGYGSRHEPAKWQGITHLSEHLFFKGTSRYSAEDISELFERTGGEVNAHTEREYTCLYSTVPYTKIELAIDLQMQILWDSVFDKEELKKEKQVVIQEIKSYLDNPDEEYLDSEMEIPWGGHSLGRRITGKAPHVSKIKAKDIDSFIENYFLRAPIVLSIVSSHKIEQVEKLVKKQFSKHRKGLRFSKLMNVTPKIVSQRAPSMSKRWWTRSTFAKMQTEQIQAGLMYPGVPLKHKDFYAYCAVSSLLGGGSSSTLYKEIRENLGLAYYISAQFNAYSDTGLLSVYLSTEKKLLVKSMAKIASEMKVFSEQLTKEKLEFVKDMYMGSTLINFEGNMARMDSMGRHQLLFGRVLPLAGLQKEIKALKLADLQRVAKVFQQKPCVYCFGPVTKANLNAILQEWE